MFNTFFHENFFTMYSYEILPHVKIIGLTRNCFTFEKCLNISKHFSNNKNEFKDFLHFCLFFILFLPFVPNWKHLLRWDSSNVIFLLLVNSSIDSKCLGKENLWNVTKEKVSLNFLDKEFFSNVWTHTHTHTNLYLSRRGENAQPCKIVVAWR